MAALSKNYWHLFPCIVFFSHAAYAYDPDAPCCHENGGPPRWYASVSGSAVFLKDVDISSSSIAYQSDAQTYHTGYAFSGAIGYKLLSGVRAELELTQRENRVNKDEFATGVIPSGTYVAQKSTAIMANTYIDLHNASHFTPYFGGGLGTALVKNPVFYTDPITSVSDGKLEDWTVAYEFMLGVNYEIDTSIAPFEIFAGYRYFATPDIKTKYNGPTPSTFTFSNSTNNFELGGRVYF